MREEAEVEILDVISLAELQELPEDVILHSWRGYALPLDSSDKASMQFDKTSRFLAAIGTGFKCAQMLASEQKVFFGELRGNKEAEELVQKLAAEFFLSPGGPQDGFRALRAETTKAVAAFCRGKGSACEVNAPVAPGFVPDTCERPQVFCTRALACAEAHSKKKMPLLDGEWTQNIKPHDINPCRPIVL